MFESIHTLLAQVPKQQTPQSHDYQTISVAFMQHLIQVPAVQATIPFCQNSLQKADTPREGQNGCNNEISANYKP